MSPNERARSHGSNGGSDFSKVGEHLLPGLQLHRVLYGHMGWINRIEWSPIDNLLASVGNDGTIQIWDGNSAQLKATLGEKLLTNKDAVICLTWSPDGKYLVTGSGDRQIHIWDVGTEEILTTLNGHNDWVFSVDWSPDKKMLASGSTDHRVIIWDPSSGDILHSITLPAKVFYVAWSPPTRTEMQLTAACEDGNIYIWHSKTRKIETILNAHSGEVLCLDWSPDGKYLVSGSVDSTIRIWDTATWNEKYVIEGHTGHVRSLSFSHDAQLLASKSADKTVRLWSCASWDTVAVIQETPSEAWAAGISFHPQTDMLATLGDMGLILRIWSIDPSMLRDNLRIMKSVRYTTAKIVLVGDSGVGKTGLGWCLSHGEFKESPSTHGQMFWVIDELCQFIDEDDTQRVTVLWDLAGQHSYRPIHSIFLEDITIALVVFDPTNRQDPLKGVRYWLGQLRGDAGLPPTLLVGARVDNGASTVPPLELSQFCQQQKISGGYINTSAKEGLGIEALLEKCKSLIREANISTIITSQTFKRIKDYVLTLKEAQNSKTNVVVSVDQLKEMLKKEDIKWRHIDDELSIAIKHLENHGYVSILQSFKCKYVLLKPELLPCLAASIVLLAEKESIGPGAISEETLLKGGYFFEDLVDVAPNEQHILIEAAVLRFLKHNVCLRETCENEDTLLIFPGLIKQRRPLHDDFPMTESTSYLVEGKIENLYAVLVVLIANTPTFTRVNQWQNQVQYEINEGEFCGFRMLEDREGELELVLYFSDNVSESGRNKFQQIFEHFLYQRKVKVKPIHPLFCPNDHQIQRSIVVDYIHQDKELMFCPDCGSRVTMSSYDDADAGICTSKWLQREESVARLRTCYEANLARVKSYRRGSENPRCFISRVPRPDTRAERFIQDLLDAGVYIVEDINDVRATDKVIILENSLYKTVWRRPPKKFKPEVAFIQARLGQKKHERTVISITIEKEDSSHEPHQLDECPLYDFSDVTHYPVNMFNLVLRLYAIPRNMNEYKNYLKTLHQRWEKIPDSDDTWDTGKRFDIALSYPGQYRPFVKSVTDKLASELGEGRVFHDENYKHELVGLDMDIYLQDIYYEQSEIVVVFLSEDYQESEWCGVEWRAIRERIKQKDIDNIVLVRLDDFDKISGLYSIDNAIDATKAKAGKPSKQVARTVSRTILERFHSGRGRSNPYRS